MTGVTEPAGPGELLSRAVLAVDRLVAGSATAYSEGGCPGSIAPPRPVPPVAPGGSGG